MSLMHKPIDEINESDLQQLIDTPIYESRLLDYKEQLPGEASADKKEFLYDVTSFANAGGGELIYGISEERIDGKTTGKPLEIQGVSIPNKDELIRKYENLIRTSVQPRIFSLQIEAIPLSNSNYVLIIRIPKSLNSPHMVTLEGNQRFYTRNSAGKHPMDISEIKSTILATSNLSDRIKSLRLDRASQIKNNQGNIRLNNTPHYIVVHLIPFSAFGTEQFHPKKLEEQVLSLKPFYTMGWDHKYNLDGLMTFSKWQNADHAHAYVQFFRNGVIESVDNGMLKPDGNRKIIPSVKIEKDIIDHAYGYLQAQKSIGVAPPIVLAISLLGVYAYEMGVSNMYYRPDHGGKIEHEDIFIPELILENYPQDKNELARFLQGSFDILWNAAGWPKSINYNNDGDWVGQRW